MSNPPKPATTAPTSPRGGTGSTPSEPSNASTMSSAAVALNMSWQLLVVLVLPLWGGYALDQHFNTSPILMCVGMVVAVAGSIVVVRQAMTQLNEIMQTNRKDDR